MTEARFRRKDCILTGRTLGLRAVYACAVGSLGVGFMLHQVAKIGLCFLSPLWLCQDFGMQTRQLAQFQMFAQPYALQGWENTMHYFSQSFGRTEACQSCQSCPTSSNMNTVRFAGSGDHVNGPLLTAGEVWPRGFAAGVACAASVFMSSSSLLQCMQGNGEHRSGTKVTLLQ